MNFVALFKQAGRLVWREKQWWVLGIMLGIGDILSGVVRFYMSLVLPNFSFRVTSWLQKFQSNPFGAAADDLVVWRGWISVTAVSLFVGSLLLWLLITWAEAGLITAVFRAHHNRVTTVGQALKAGYRLVGRFVRIDALVFLPWFLLALLIFLLFNGILIGTIIYAAQSSTKTFPTFSFFGFICLIPFALLLIPVGTLSFIYRLLAFRDAAILGHGVREAVRHTRLVIRRHFAEIMLLILLLSGGIGLLNSLLGWGMVSLFSLTAVISSAPAFSFQQIIVTFIMVTGFLLITGLKVILSLLTAAVWTLAYAEWITEN